MKLDWYEWQEDGTLRVNVEKLAKDLRDEGVIAALKIKINSLEQCIAELEWENDELYESNIDLENVAVELQNKISTLQQLLEKHGIEYK